jgi:hypothetical protein
MARCDQGYLCRICGEEVENITDSELYLRYVIGEIDPEVLHTTPECHLLCAPALAQFIRDPRFETIAYDDPLFGLASLDESYVETRSNLVSRGYARLWEIRQERRKPLTVVEYPLPEFAAKWR